MASYQWIKLYDDILDDPKMGRLSDGAYRFCINLFLLASRQESRNGTLPDLADVAWTLRLDEETAAKYWSELERAEIVWRDDSSQGVTHFAERQGAVTGNERVKQYRQRQQKKVVTPEPETSNDVVTKSYTDIDKDLDQDQDKKKKLPPTPQGVRDGANFEGQTLEDEFWGKAQTLVNEWQDIIGDYRPLDANRRQDKTDFFAPALRMINDFGGDYAAAWQAVRAERERMIRDGLGNVRKLSAVVTGVLAGLERARLPELPPAHQGNGNGRKLSNAEAGAVEYAAIRNQFVRSKT